MAGHCERDIVGADCALRRLDADAAATLDDEAGDLAVLDDVDAARIGGARITPGDGVMAGNAGPALPAAAEDRIARAVAAIEQRRLFEHAVRSQQLGIGAVDLHGVDDARSDFHLGVGMRDRHHAALRQHDVVVELAAQPLVEFQREIVERDALGIEIVGADGGGVAAGIAAAEPALLDAPRHC